VAEVVIGPAIVPKTVEEAALPRLAAVAGGSDERN
jgi:hypothetical protein